MIEITESALLRCETRTLEILGKLRKLGVRLVLDDFGTGYSSLAYLRRLPLDTIKVDRTFVSGLGEETADLPIAEAVIAMAHGLGIDVVAEGIETLAQREMLRDLDCDRGQGYWFARPLPADEMERLLASATGSRAVLPRTD